MTHDGNDRALPEPRDPAIDGQTLYQTFRQITRLNAQIQERAWTEEELARMHTELRRALSRLRAARQAAAAA